MRDTCTLPPIIMEVSNGSLQYEFPFTYIQPFSTSRNHENCEVFKMMAPTNLWTRNVFQWIQWVGWLRTLGWLKKIGCLRPCLLQLFCPTQSSAPLLFVDLSCIMAALARTTTFCKACGWWEPGGPFWKAMLGERTVAASDVPGKEAWFEVIFVWVGKL